MILVVIGTRPEAIKLAPVVAELLARDDADVRVLLSGQHRDLVRPVLDFFAVPVSWDLDLMEEGQSPNDLLARAIAAIDRVFLEEEWSGVVVQGDTSTALAAAVAGFNRKVPVYHVEAGLRSGDREDPFPEEMNRQLISRLATTHFAPTERNVQNLVAEGIDAERILLTGNTVIDALQRIVPEGSEESRRHHLLLTTHRRENHGDPQRQIFAAINQILELEEEVSITFPIHPNPAVRNVADEVLREHPRLKIIEPLNYIPFLQEIARSGIVLTDSGGVQEEAPALGVPVLVLRETTEREEVIEAGGALRVGTETEAIVRAVQRLLRDDALYTEMARPRFPFGKPGASRKIAAHLCTTTPD